MDKIADKCRLPREALQLKGEDLQFEPSPDTRYEVVDCVLKGIRTLPCIKAKMGFIGNERYGSEGGNNAETH